MRRFDPPLPLPIKPKLLVQGIEASSCTMFQSAMCPLKLDFYVVSKDELSHLNHIDNTKKDRKITQILGAGHHHPVPQGPP